MAEEMDAADLANKELAEAAVPTPESFIDELGPLAAVLYLRQTAYAVLEHYTALLTAAADGDVDDGSEPVQAMQGLALIAGQADAVAVLLGVIEPDQVAPS